LQAQFVLAIAEDSGWSRGIPREDLLDKSISTQYGEVETRGGIDRAIVGEAQAFGMAFSEDLTGAKDYGGLGIGNLGYFGIVAHAFGM